jgi:tetratricopeptide (TPR) repeat protein
LDIRVFERARRAFEKAGEESRVKWITARIEELNGDTKKAGQLYSEINDFLRSATCFESSKDWANALTALEKLPTTRDVSRRIAICRFRRDVPTEREKAARDFFSYFRYDQGVELDSLKELADILIETDPHSAGEVLERIGDTVSLAKAAQVRFKEGDFVRAVDLYRKSGITSTREYSISLAEKLGLDKDYGGAIEILYSLGAHERVVEIYENAIQARWAPGYIRSSIAKSYAALGQTEAAMLVLEELSVDLTKRNQWVKAISCIGPDLFYRDRRIENYCRIISMAVESRRAFSDEEKEQLMGAARFVVAVPYWDFRIKPESMGIIYSQCGTVTERVDFYRQFLNEPWTYTAYLQALEELIRFQHQNNDEVGARRTESEIKQFKKQKGLR